MEIPLEISFPFVASTLGVPVLAYVLSFLVRKSREMYPSAAADFVLLLFVTDMLFVIDSEKVIGLLRHATFQQNVVPIFVLMAIVSLIVWYSCMMCEDAIQSSSTKQVSIGADFPFWRWLVGNLLWFILLLGHAVILAYKGTQDA